MVPSISFQSFLYRHLKLSSNFENSVRYCYTSYEMTKFYDFSFKLTATAGIRIHPTKVWLSQMMNFKNAIRHFRRTIYSLISIFEWQKRFKEGKESVRDDERCGMSKEVNTPQLIRKGFGLGLLCWGFKGVQEEIPRDEASTLQIGSVVFPAGQCTSPQLHPCHRLFDQDGHQHSSSPSL